MDQTYNRKKKTKDPTKALRLHQKKTYKQTVSPTNDINCGKATKTEIEKRNQNPKRTTYTKMMNKKPRSRSTYKGSYEIELPDSNTERWGMDIMYKGDWQVMVHETGVARKMGIKT